MKTCIKCEREKPREMFYANKKSADGFDGTCKACSKAGMRATYRRNKANPIWLLGERRRGRLKAQREREKGIARKPEAEKARLFTRQYRKEHPDILRAHNLVAYALQRGELKKSPCEKCGSTNKVQAHHDDYVKPLAVRWLCHHCHAAHHVALNEQVLCQSIAGA